MTTEHRYIPPCYMVTSFQKCLHWKDSLTTAAHYLSIVDKFLKYQPLISIVAQFQMLKRWSTVRSPCLEDDFRQILIENNSLPLRHNLLDLHLIHIHGEISNRSKCSTETLQTRLRIAAACWSPLLNCCCQLGCMLEMSKMRNWRQTLKSTLCTGLGQFNTEDGVKGPHHH